MSACLSKTRNRVDLCVRRRVNKSSSMRTLERTNTNVVPQSREPTNSPCLRSDMAKVNCPQITGRRKGDCVKRTIRGHTYWRLRDKSAFWHHHRDSLRRSSVSTDPAAARTVRQLTVARLPSRDQAHERKSQLCPSKALQSHHSWSLPFHDETAVFGMKLISEIIGQDPSETPLRGRRVSGHMTDRVLCGVAALGEKSVEYHVHSARDSCEIPLLPSSRSIIHDLPHTKHRTTRPSETSRSSYIKLRSTSSRRHASSFQASAPPSFSSISHTKIECIDGRAVLIMTGPRRGLILTKDGGGLCSRTRLSTGGKISIEYVRLATTLHHLPYQPRADMI